MKLSEIKTPAEKLFAMIDVNIDYVNGSGRDVNKDFKLAIEFKTEAEAQKFFDEFEVLGDESELEFGDDSDTDADDIANSHTMSHSITSGVGIVAKPPKSAVIRAANRVSFAGIKMPD